MTTTEALLTTIRDYLVKIEAQNAIIIANQTNGTQKVTVVP